MIEDKITFDRFIRWMIVLAMTVAGIWMLGRLSSVLLPFAVAWLLAYMTYPLVCFVQVRLRVRSRILSIILSMLAILLVLAAFLALIVPPLIEETTRLARLTTVYFHDVLEKTNLSTYLEEQLTSLAAGDSLMSLAQQNTFVEFVQALALQVWNLLASTVNLALGILGTFIVLLYMFFILLDYEKISNGWVGLIPQGKRHFATMVVEDVKKGMNAYFRGQALVAFCVGILFCIGFLIIDFPLAIGLGLFIGLLNMVPYMQLIGFVPTILLAIVKSAETGENLWIILLCALAVFAVVQLIQDMYLTPRIMGQVMGLNPAVILLSLSVWGSLLGIMGLIIALPLTTLLLSYYKRFVLKEDNNGEKEEAKEKKNA